MAKNIKIKEVCEKVPVLMESLIKKRPEGITRVDREGEEWKVQAEVLERKAVPDTQDILSTYELRLTGDLELAGYKRNGMRRRGDIVVEEET